MSLGISLSNRMASHSAASILHIITHVKHSVAGLVVFVFVEGYPFRDIPAKLSDNDQTLPHTYTVHIYGYCSPF